MIVFDASTLVSATFRRGSVPDQAVRQAIRTDQIAVSDPVMAELLEMLYWPRPARFIDPELRIVLLGQLGRLGVVVAPTVSVTDCRDAKDDKYLELALAANATAIVSSDDNLLVLHPWRGIQIVRPAEYFATAGVSTPGPAA